MNCNKFESRIQDLMDRREDPAHDPELIEHAQVCSCCSPRWQVWSQMGQANPSRAFGFRDGRAFASLVLEELDAVVQLPDAAGEKTDSVCLRVPSARENAWGRRLAASMALTASLIVFVFCVSPSTLTHESGQTTQSLAALTASNSEPVNDLLLGIEAQPEKRVSSLADFQWRDLDYQAFAHLGGESMSVVDPMVRPMRLAYVLVQRGLLIDSLSKKAEWRDDDRLRLILDYVA